MQYLIQMVLWFFILTFTGNVLAVVSCEQAPKKTTSEPNPQSQNVNPTINTLNTLYNTPKDTDKCGVNPTSSLYQCPGVFVHTFDPDDIKNMRPLSNITFNENETVCPITNNSFPWCPKTETGAVSFSMLRNDITAHNPKGVMIFPGSGKTLDVLAGSGFIFIFDGTNRSISRVKPLCFYPVNGNTADKDDCGCSMTKTDTPRCPQSEAVSSCDGQNISDAGDYINRYGPFPGLNKKGYLTDPICSISPSNFPFFKEVTQKVQYSKFSIDMNEVIFRSWAGSNYTKQIPLTAFFYWTSKNSDQKQVINAWHVADAYYKATNNWKPVIKIDMDELRKENGTPFECGIRPSEYR